MDLFSKITKRNSDTPFGKFVDKHRQSISVLSFFVYFIPMLLYIISNDFLVGSEVSPPGIFVWLFMWYFFSFAFLGKVKKETLKSQIFEFIICLPIYTSFIITYFIVKFVVKEKHPNVIGEELFLHERKTKIKRLKRKIRWKKLRIFS